MGLIKLDLSDSREYLEALKVAENFPALYVYAQTHDADHLIDEAMDTIEKWCPWLWPQIDRIVSKITENTGILR